MFTHVDLPKCLDEISSETSIHGTRSYKVPSGEIYPSVTTVLGDKPKPWLEKWKQSLGEQKAKKESKRSSNRGTIFHALVEQHLNNIDNVTNNIPDPHKKLFNQAKPKLNNINNIQSQEAGIYSDVLKIAGRVDCVANFNNKPSIIDFKTSNNPKTANMILDYYLQCTAYALMWNELTDQAIDNIIVIIAVENGFVSQVFEQKIDNYVPLLLKRIHEYYAKR